MQLAAILAGFRDDGRQGRTLVTWPETDRNGQRRCNRRGNTFNGVCPTNCMGLECPRLPGSRTATYVGKGPARKYDRGQRE